MYNFSFTKEYPSAKRHRTVQHPNLKNALCEWVIHMHFTETCSYYKPICDIRLRLPCDYHYLIGTPLLGP